MLERHMEDLIAEFAEEFFPRHVLTLKGRQQSFSGVGRFDLLFEDQFSTLILMELKARPARYEDASQLAKYKDELKRISDKPVIMWLVAPLIPASVREFLEQIGIEYSEIHKAEFYRVAERHGVEINETFKRERIGQGIPQSPALEYDLIRGNEGSEHSTHPFLVSPAVSDHPDLEWDRIGFDLLLLNPTSFSPDEFASLVDSFARAVSSRKNKRLVAELMNWGEHPGQLLTKAVTCSLLRWAITSGWKDARPSAFRIWSYLFGSPAPNWYQWKQLERRYHFDVTGWEIWYESLSVSGSAGPAHSDRELCTGKEKEGSPI